MGPFPDRGIKVALSCNYKVAHYHVASIVNRQGQKWAPGDSMNSDYNGADTFDPSTFIDDVTPQEHKYQIRWLQLGNTSITD